MIDPHSDDFQIRFTNEEPDDYIEQEITERKFDRLGRRLTIISILIPCIIGVIVFIAYLDVRKKYDEMKSWGAIEVQNLSSDLESRFSSLSLKFAKFEKDMGTQLSQFQKAAANAQQSVNQTAKQLETLLKKQIAKLDKGKASKQELKKSLTLIQQDVKPLQENLVDLKAQINQLDKNINMVNGTLKQTITEYAQRFIEYEETVNALNASAAQLKSDMGKLKDNTSQLTVDAIKQDSLDSALKNQYEKQEQRLALLARNVEAQLSAIKTQIERLKGQMPGTHAKKTTPATPPPTSTKAATPPKQGPIIEQDIE
jgi:chromosome segregation ATPase